MPVAAPTVTGVQVQQHEGGMYTMLSRPWPSRSRFFSATTYTLTAKSEVILSAGSINTPMILMLSGLGDPSVLTPLKIPVVKNISSVGKDLQVR